MKKLFLTSVMLALSFMSLVLVNCTRDDIELRDDSNSLVQDARNYFELNGSDIQPARVGRGASGEGQLTRSMALSSRVISPRWGGEVKTFRHGEISTVEVPLTGDVHVRSVYTRRTKKDVYESAFSRVKTMLIVQKHHELDEYRSFVVTMIGDRKHERRKVSSRDFGFIDRQEFSGLMIISSLEGEYLDAHEYGDGEKRRVILARAAGFENVEKSEVTGRFNLMDAAGEGIYTRMGELGGGTGDGESGGGGGSGGGGSGGAGGDSGGTGGGTGGNTGGSSGSQSCQFCGQYGCEGDCEVTVTWCKRCNRGADDCICCVRCKPNVCTCYAPPLDIWKCPRCGDKFCPGDCPVVEPPTTGGGGSADDVTPVTDKIYGSNSTLTKDQKNY